MACETKTWLVLHFLLLVSCYMQHCVNGDLSQVPCLFIFGDSLSDSGNNNLLVTNAKSNYKPYGIDFPEGPTGRFTNGRTTIDIIGQLLGFNKFIPPFANTVGSDIFKGVNYASGVAGIRDESGKRSIGYNIALGQQLENHKTIVSQIAAKLGGVPQAQIYLNKCLYYVNIGTNDYLENYFLPALYSTSLMYNPQQYAQVLVDQLSLNLETLHTVGARKLVLVGLYRLGCNPLSLLTSGVNKGLCNEVENVDILIFNDKLRSLVDQLNIQHLDSKSIYIDIPAIRFENFPGFAVKNAPCCPITPAGSCIVDSIPCLNRNEYAFYDAIHPSSAANIIIASNSYDSSSIPTATYPMDIKHLANLFL